MTLCRYIQAYFHLQWRAAKTDIGSRLHISIRQVTVVIKARWVEECTVSCACAIGLLWHAYTAPNRKCKSRVTDILVLFDRIQ